MIALATPPAPVKPRTIEELIESVSASRLSTWQRCRLQFWFRYVAGIQKPPSPALHVGSTVHSVLQQWNLARWRKTVLDTEALKAVFDQAWTAQEGIDWEEGEDAAKQSAWAVLEYYFRYTPIPADEIPEGVEVSVEADLTSHGLPRLIGVLDLVRSGGRIVDFKTSARSPDPGVIAHTHETQTTAYAVLYRQATDGVESGIELHHLIKTKVPKLVVTELGTATKDQFLRLFRVMEDYIDGLERERFVPAPGLQCSSCEYLAECRKWKGGASCE